MKVRAREEKNFRRARVKPVKKRAAGRLRSWRTLVACTVAALGAYALYRATDLVLSATVLQVKKISVQGNVRLSSGEVRALVDGLRGQSILAADLERYRLRLLESPWVADVALRRMLPSAIEVVVSERTPIGLCRLGRQLYLLDRTGTIIDEFGPQYAEFDLPIIDGVVRPEPGHEPAIDQRHTELAARLLDALEGHPHLEARVSQIDVRDPYDAVVLLDGDPALLHLGTARFAERLQGYVEIATALRDRVADIDYVDLRFDERIYVRPRGSAALRLAGRPAARN